MNKFIYFTSKVGLIIFAIIVVLALKKNLFVGSLLGIIFIIVILIEISREKTLKQKEMEEFYLKQYNKEKENIPSNAKKITISEFYYKDISCSNVETLWWISNDNLIIISAEFTDNFGRINIPKKDIWYFTTMDKIYEYNGLCKKQFNSYNGNEITDLNSFTIKNIKQFGIKCDNDEIIMAIKDEEDFSYMYLDKNSYNDLLDILPSKELKD